MRDIVVQVGRTGVLTPKAVSYTHLSGAGTPAHGATSASQLRTTERKAKCQPNGWHFCCASRPVSRVVGQQAEVGSLAVEGVHAVGLDAGPVSYTHLLSSTRLTSATP